MFITETVNLVSKTSAKHVARYDYLTPEIYSRFDDFNKKFMEILDDGNFQVNSYMDDKFDFILPIKDISKNLGIKYASGFTPTDEDHDDKIVKGQPNDEDDVIDKYLNMKSLFDFDTND